MLNSPSAGELESDKHMPMQLLQPFVGGDGGDGGNNNGNVACEGDHNSGKNSGSSGIATGNNGNGGHGGTAVGGECLYCDVHNNWL